jgi:hypothetical protein
MLCDGTETLTECQDAEEEEYIHRSWVGGGGGEVALNIPARVGQMKGCNTRRALGLFITLLYKHKEGASAGRVEVLYILHVSQRWIKCDKL